MSSARFPGKVLAPFRGRPILAHVVERARAAVAPGRVFVVTSDLPSDDPVAAYAASAGIDVFRGPLDDVFERFRQAALTSGADWVLRVNADSPVMSLRILRAVVDAADESCDLVSTIAPRTLPKGQNPEAVRVSMLEAAAAAALTPSDREHVTAWFYRHPESCRIRNMSSGREGLAALNFSVDTVEDLARLESLSEADLERLLPGTLHG